MGNCQKFSKKNRRKIAILLVGLDNSGKTTTAKAVQNLPLNSVAPTVGYTADEFKFGKYQVTLIDVGGGKRIRDIWKNYFAEVHGVVYVVDASDHTRIQECKSELTQLLKNPLIQEKPLLLLANKQDKVGALDEVDINAKLNLEELVNENRCYCKVETTSAIAGKKNHSIKNGLVWILGAIDLDYDRINDRVVIDSRTRDLKLKEEMAIRRQQVMARRQAELEEEEKANQNKATEHPSLRPPVPGSSEKSNSPNPETKTLKSGLGSQLLDDDNFDCQINLPGSVDNLKGLPRPVIDDDVIRPISRSLKSHNSPVHKKVPALSGHSGAPSESPRPCSPGESPRFNTSMSVASDASMEGSARDITSVEKPSSASHPHDPHDTPPEQPSPGSFSKPPTVLPPLNGRPQKLPPLFAKPNADDDVML